MRDLGNLIDDFLATVAEWYLRFFMLGITLVGIVVVLALIVGLCSQVSINLD